MPIRQWLERNSVLVITVSVMVMAAALALVLWPQRRISSADFRFAYFYDLNTQKIFRDDAQAIPPIDTESGAGAGVRAMVVTCGGCGEDERFVAWMERYTPEGKKKALAYQAQMRAHPSSDIPEPTGGQEIRSGKDPTWYPSESPRGQQIRQSLYTLCNGKSAITCRP